MTPKRGTRRPGPRPSRPAPTLKPGPGEHAWVLDVPWELRSAAAAAGATWVPDYGHVFVGRALPPLLTPYLPRDYSWQAYLANKLSGGHPPRPTAPPVPGSITLRPEQKAAVVATLRARAAGAPELLNGSGTGVGKTFMTIAAVKRMPTVRRVLVVCPLSVMPAWRVALQQIGDGGLTWVIINYDSLKRLITIPPSAATAKRTRTKNLRRVRDGKPRAQWDVVIADESHYVANIEAQRSRALETIINGPTGTPPAFVMRLTATAGANPAKLAYLHRGLAWRTGRPIRTAITEADYSQMCTQWGVTVSPGRFSGLEWGGNPADLKRMHHLLFGGAPPWGIKVEPTWAGQQRFPFPVDLSPGEMSAYHTEWQEFHRALTAARQGTLTGAAAATSRAKGLAAQIRYRQKIGQIMATHVADHAATLVASGVQPVIACEFLGTANAVSEALRSHGVNVALFTGANRETREQERIDFQQGRRPVMVFTVAEGVNFQAGEAATTATMNPRVTIIAEPRWSPIKALQVEGRAHRDGQSAPAYYAYATGTVAEKVITVVLDGMMNIGQIMGSDTRPFGGLATALGVPALIEEGA